MLEGDHGSSELHFNFNGCNKLEQNSFNNIVAMKINVIFEFNRSNSPSADTNLAGKHQAEHLQIDSSRKA